MTRETEGTASEFGGRSYKPKETLLPASPELEDIELEDIELEDIELSFQDIKSVKFLRVANSKLSFVSSSEIQINLFPPELFPELFFVAFPLGSPKLVPFYSSQVCVQHPLF